ncbi:PAS domain S-box-containing protein [Streptomyces sp. Ag82_O1-12]|uniref:SpoIIE family protein phosphatase n=1 Tax=unclassified Streptomyces TaxID=2593676 RepID=UPI000BD56B53|nr:MULTISPECIES: SpoIIE family protein phosphatase [unclassified Streptomyces]SMQ20030.1 PAS domain S-box-containing protein [Streptomyces sp. Ag82_O1-12]SOD49033.1 PAS domain S-box-containing protein [Streptomyces sp. Ag82_G6-1]
MNGYATSDRDAVTAAPGGLLDLLKVAAVVLDAGGHIALWSPEIEQLLGWTAQEALRQRADTLLVSPENRPRGRELFAQVSTGARWAGVFPLRHRDGTERAVEFRTMRLLDPEGQPHLLGLATDATTVRQVERDLALSHSLVNQTPLGIAVFDNDLRWVGVNPALERINGMPEEAVLGRRVGEVLPDLDVEAIEARMRHVLETGAPLLDQQTVGRTAADAQERAYSESYHRIEDIDGRVLGLAMAVLDVTERQQAAAEVAQARQHLSVIADAGMKIGTTLDLQQTARELADVVVPHLADLAAVDVLESVVARGTITPVSGRSPAEFRALAVAAGYPTDAIHAADPVGELATYGSSRIITQCVRSARPVLVEHVDGKMMRRLARDSRAALALHEAGAHSYLALPLVARGKVLGTLSLYRTVNERPFDDRDQALASELAARAAICIDNARLYGRERGTALTLQRSLLPSTPAEREGLDIAARYRPALSEVGGDWYDVLPLGPGRTGLVVGDVMGKGVQAAAIMGQLSTATRALARLDLPPAELLRHLDDIAGSLGDAIATCVYAVCDLRRGTCELSSAGHLPPVLAGADGRAELVDVPGGVPLGVGGVEFGTVEVELAPGSLLALYTDGLVENRGEPIDTGLDTLTRLLGNAGPSLQHTSDSLLSALSPEPDDDVALLLVRTRA